MSTFVLTDNFNNPVALPVKWTSLSALFKYLRSELLHLIVLPDFIQHKDELISGIKPQPLTAQLKVGNDFQLGGTSPEIDVTPQAEVDVEVNAVAGANLFDGDPFALAATIPPKTAYVGLTFDGSLDLGISGSSGDLTFGFDGNTELKLGYWKAFPASGASQPTLGDALAQTLSNYTIPGDLTDLSRLQTGDISTASGTGSFEVAGGVDVQASPNPLASIDLPFNGGTIVVKEGVMTGLSASFRVTGSYQVRVRRLDPRTVELSFLKQKGTTLKIDLSASAGVAARIGKTDLIALLLGAIDPKSDNSQLLQGGLSADEAATLNGAIKGAIDHSLRASFDDTLSLLTDDEAAFQYHIDVDVAQQDRIANEAVHRALEGDLSKLTALEGGIKGDGTIAAGVQMISSVFSRARKKEVSFKINLLGLVNVLSLADLIRASKVIKDPVTGDLTIADSVTGGQIEAIVEPPKREERLRKAMFESLMVTAAYKASGAIEALNLTSRCFHFALNQKTNIGVMTDYLNWMVALDLITGGEKQQLLGQFHDQGPSSCVLRTTFTDAQCRSMFFDQDNQLRPEAYYLDSGRRAMMALLTDKIGPFDGYRYALLDQHWEGALEVGASPALAQVAGITGATPNHDAIVSQLVGDVYEITWWAAGMVEAGNALQSVITFLAGRAPISLRNDHAFAIERDQLQKKMAAVIGRSKTRFSEPWGLVTLFWTGGSRGSSAKVLTSAMTVTKP